MGRSPHVLDYESKHQPFEDKAMPGAPAFELFLNFREPDPLRFVEGSEGLVFPALILSCRGR